MDRRKRKTQAAIKTAFLQLIKEKPLHKITITEISEAADIGRGTFYTHYRDIYELQEKIRASFLAELLAIFDQHYPQNQSYDFTLFVKALLDYLPRHRSFFSGIAKETRDGVFFPELKESLIERIMAAEKLDSQNVKERTEIIFYINGMMGVLSDWLEEKLVIEQDALETILEKLLET